MAMTAMVAVTNLLDAAFMTVLVPVWAKDTGGGADAIGLFLATFSGAAVIGSVMASSLGPRLPRYRTYVVAFMLAGLPRFVVLALGCRSRACWRWRWSADSPAGSSTRSSAR